MDVITKPTPAATPAELFKAKSLHQLNISHLKIIRGIYFLVHFHEIVYVGQSTNIIGRILTHIDEATKKFNDVFFIPVPTGDLLKIESAYISSLNPKYNGGLKRKPKPKHSLIITHAETLDTAVRL
jgi:hypothetical protein